MAKYLLHGNYMGDGLKGLLKEGGSSRRAAMEKALKSLGGTVECFYYALGEDDYFIIADMPDNVSAAALTLTVRASGAGTMKTTVLMAPEEMDEVVRKSPAYRAPGQ
jgi:uncharacterized protein with GYD domain